MRNFPDVRNYLLLFLFLMLVQAKNSKGFTLVELIVVITILAILATIGFLSLQGYTQDAKETKTVANLRTVSSSLVNESAITGNSFDYYMNTGTTNALADAAYTIYGTSASLSGGVNYNVGTVKASALKIDGSKFFDKNAAGTEKPFVVAAVTLGETINGKTRQRASFQVAGTLKGTTGESALVEGTFAPQTGDVQGLITITSAHTETDVVTHQGSKVPYTLQ